MTASTGIAARHAHLVRAAALAGQCFASAPEEIGVRVAPPLAAIAWLVTGAGAALVAGGALLFLS